MVPKTKSAQFLHPSKVTISYCDFSKSEREENAAFIDLAVPAKQINVSFTPQRNKCDFIIISMEFYMLPQPQKNLFVLKRNQKYKL